MANNYTKILELANKNNMGLSNTIKRDYGIPLDYSSVQESYEAALNYAKTNTLAYIGQPISVGDTLYIVTDETNGYLKAIGTQPAGDEQSVTIEADGKITIKGFSSASNATLPRKTSEGTLEWVAIDAIVDGDGNTKTVVQTAEGSAITVIPTYDSKTDTYTYTLDVVFPAIPEYSVTKELNDNQVAYKLTKDGNVVGESIVVPNAYDDSAITERVDTLESDLGGHAERIISIENKVNTFFATVENPDGVINTLDEIQKYIADDQTGAAGIAASIKENADAIGILNGEGTGSVKKTVEDAIAAQSVKDAENYASQAALDAVADTINETTAQVAELETEFNNRLDTASNQIAAIDTALKTKIDTTVLTEALSDYYSKDETYNKTAIDTLLAGIKGEYGETADSVAAALAAHTQESSSKFFTIETKNNKQDASIQELTDAIDLINSETIGILAQAKADAAAKVEELKNGIVTENSDALRSLVVDLNSINEDMAAFAESVATFERIDNQLAEDLATTTKNLEDLSSSVANYDNALTALQKKDDELSAAIAANTGKFEDYLTVDEVADKIDEKLAEFDLSDLSDAISANTTAISAEVSRATDEESRLGNLIQANTNAIDDNAAEIQRVNSVLSAVVENDGEGLDSIKELANWIKDHDIEVIPAVETNTANIATLMGTGEGSITQTVQNAINAIPHASASKAGLVKASAEIAVANDGTMEIGTISTDKLVQGTNILVLNGGTAVEQPLQ